MPLHKLITLTSSSSSCFLTQLKFFTSISNSFDSSAKFLVLAEYFWLPVIFANFSTNGVFAYLRVDAANLQQLVIMYYISVDYTLNKGGESLEL